MLCFKNLLQNLLLVLLFIQVYVVVCASASGGQERVLMPRAAFTGSCEPPTVGTGS